MNTEPISLPSPSTSTEETQSLSLPSFLSSSSSSIKPLRERNRTNLKRRINLSRSQVLSNDFENNDNLLPTTSANIMTTTTTATTAVTTNSQPLPSTPNIHAHTELYCKTISPTTPSPIHNTVTCSQVWERLASNEEHQNSILPKPVSAPATSLPTHISFSYDPSDDDEEGDDLPRNDKDDFQYVPVSSQSKLVQFQFLTFARQQQLVNIDNDDNKNNEKQYYDSDDDDESNDDEDEQEDTLINHPIEDNEEDQENRTSKKRKRSVSTTDSLDGISALPMTNNDATTSSSTTKQPRTKKPKIKDPNANFQRLNMRRKNYSHGKKHQFAKHKRNAFYRRMRHAGGK